MLRVLCCGWMLSVGLSVAALRAEDTVPSLENLRTAYLANVGSIHTMESDLAMTQTSNDPKLQAEETFPTDFELRILRTGDLRSRSQLLRNAAGTPLSQSWCGYDGRLYSRWEKFPEGALGNDYLPFGEIQPEVMFAVYEELTIELLTGEVWRSRETSVGDLLALPGTQVVGWEAIGGAPCVKVVTPRHIMLRRYPDLLCMETTMWFDPAVNYLPRRIETLDYSGKRPEPSSDSVETTEYREYPGADGRRYTLPAAGRRTRRFVNSTMVVKSVVINGKIPREAFKPKFPEPCRVTETLPNQPKRERFVGATKEQYERLQLEIDERAGRLKINGVPVTIEQFFGKEQPPPTIPTGQPLPDKPRRFPWSYVFLGSAGLLAILGYWSWRRSDRPL